MLRLNQEVVNREVSIERKTFFVEWAASASNRLLSITEIAKKKWVRGFLSCESCEWLAAILELGEEAFQKGRQELRELAEEPFSRKDTQAVVDVSLEENYSGSYAKFSITPLSNKGRRTTICIPAARNGSGWGLLASLITMFVKSFALNLEKEQRQMEAAPISLNESSVGSRSYRDVLLCSDEDQRYQKVTITASFKNCDEDWGKFMTLIKENSRQSRSIGEEIHLTTNSGQVRLKTTIIAVDAEKLGGEDEVDMEIVDTGGNLGMEGTVAGSGQNRSVPSELDATRASGKSAARDSNSNLALKSKFPPFIANLDVVNSQSGLGVRCIAAKAGKELRNPTYPWISKLSQEVNIRDILQLKCSKKDLHMRANRVDRRSFLSHKLDTPPLVETCLQPPPTDLAIESSPNPRIEALDFNTEDEIDLVVEDSEEEGQRVDIVDTNGQLDEVLVAETTDPGDIKCVEPDEGDADEEFARLSASIEMWETNETGDEAESSLNVPQIQALNQGLLTLGARIGMSGVSTGVSLPLMIENLEHKVQRAMERPRRRTAGKKPHRYRDNTSHSEVI